MKLLAIDSSGLPATVAIVSGEDLLGEFTIHHKKTHSQTLLPMLKHLADTLAFRIEELDAIAVTGGPGSFTGLRIGYATAKGLALALQKPMIHIPTLDALAYNLWGNQQTICPLMDARRNQTYTALYRFCGAKMERLKEPCAVDIAVIVDAINKRGEPVVFLGDGVFVFSQYIKENSKVPYLFAPPHVNKQRAGTVAALAKQYYKEGNVLDAAESAPDYLRLSQAERERMEREHASN